jgi:uncharacterized membrane protein
MSEADRIAGLEQRLQVLESLVRQLVTDRTAPQPDAPSAAPAAAPPPRLTPEAPPPPSRPLPPPPTRPLPPPPPPSARAAGTPTPGTAPLFSEQWFGQRGLLAVGVTFVILAAGYLLKLSFDRGWISPLMRCVAGTLAGAGIGFVGWRLHGRGTRTYGAALIGCGAAVMYLSVWAATRLYQFLSPTPAIAALALVSLGLAAIALAIDVEALGATAALGAFFAPIIIGKEGGDVDLLLLYLGAIGGALGWVSTRRRWRLATLVIALAYFGIAGSGVLTEANSALLYLYAVLGGAAGLYVGLREGWFETRLLAFGGGWGVLAVANGASSSHWPTLLGGIVLTAPVWLRALRARMVWPDGWALGDSFYFYLSPLLLGAALHEVAPSRFDRDAGLVPALVAVPYLIAGLTAVRRPFALVAALALGGAALAEWSGLEAVWALLLLSVLWAAMDHLLKRDDGRWYSLLSLLVGIGHLVQVDLPRQAEAERAFVGPWAMTLWLAIAVTVALALRLLRDERTELVRTGLRSLLWGLAGVLLFFGVTGELLQYFQQARVDAETVTLAGGLSVSAWWICFAAGCFFVGFRRQVRPLRLAGFMVAGLALLKVVFVDLSQLDALYRVGSAFILGVVSLAVAYAYHRGGSTQGRSG